MDKESIIKTLEEIALMLELKGENPFKIKAYKNAARIIEVSSLDIDKDIDEAKLKELSGIGEGLAENIKKLASGERLDFYEELKESITPQLLELLKIPGLGPKKVKFLFENLDILSIQDLESAVKQNMLFNLPGFGQKSQENISNGIDTLKKYRQFFLYADVIDEANDIVKKLLSSRNIARSSVAGSLRRKKETVKDIDMVAGISEGGSMTEAANYFSALDKISEITSKGETKISARLNSGINIDLRIVPDKLYPYLLNHFTGSKEHNTVLRSMAKDLGLKVNEYGIFKGERLISCESEEDIYKIFNMDYIEPELRENTGEVQSALNKNLPELLDEKDIKGIFHIHTTFSDGNISLESLYKKLKRTGYGYAGISDHSQSAFYAGGIKSSQIDSYLKEIDFFCSQNKDIKIFKGIESDITSDGNLDYSEEILKKFDFIIASVHSGFGLSEEEMTQRIIRAIENKYTTMLAHPTGRLLLSREPYKVDMIKVINAASINNTAIEINSNPYRLDLDWRLCKYAKEKKVKIFINPDAHSLEDIDNVKYGVNIARKGWLEKNDVVNTMELGDIINFLKELKNKKQI